MLKADFSQLLEQYPFLVVDGAMATELEKSGCDLNHALWSAKVLREQPELIAEVHQRYFEAGADIAITASYQASFAGFKAYGMDEQQARETIARSVELAATARDRFWQEYDGTDRPRPMVAASVGPYGAYLADGSEYRGHYGVDDQTLKEFHRSRMAVLVEAGADLLACETLPSLQEARVLSELLAEFPQTCAWITFSARDGECISDGTPIAECVRALDELPQIVAVGVNCTALEHIPSLLKNMSRHTRLPLIVYPNSGEQYDADSKTWRVREHCSHHSLGSEVAEWVNLGARLVGGCCRTSPDDIKAVAEYRGEVAAT
ncbi:homocysteine S-methyltransferase [Gynuella sunshinyii]|uniref:S-methylmethionine:homocysteine methyltransferase n=1 Tax=Gynuella sunshinyii YC6258 TaxID=1445510 RepID=A0A0C5VU32_9GAMM|nr:homocysteine S-methyltransferase [Gynuella sunshinyii]AJQ96803.1 homocysteine/selenocysteine methylase (S-methylmethionine-dependent) [Gynuella sunshinyii YC6258]